MKQRLLSVDVFRGITILAMILVNNPGTWSHIYAPLKHAPWHGLTPTDLIFPFFLYIVGITIVLAYKNTKIATAKTYKKITIRSLKLIGLGLVLAVFLAKPPFFKPLETLRFPGVLQRIGIVFFIVAILYFNLSKKGLLITFISILVVYWLLMTEVPIDGVLPLLTRESNLASTIDLKVLTEAHMWTKLHDPEGVLSTLPAIATSISGILTGFILIDEKINPLLKVRYYLIAAVILLALGYLWHLSFPMNKALWTSSFILVTTGWGLIVFTAIYYLCDIKNIQNWSNPFVAFGMNAITVFFLSGFFAKCFYHIKLSNGKSIHSNLFSVLQELITAPKLASLIYALFVVLFYYMLAMFLYKRKIFIKV